MAVSTRARIQSRARGSPHPNPWAASVNCSYRKWKKMMSATSSSDSPSAKAPVSRIWAAISNASRLSTVSISLSFNPAVLRVRTVQEGNLMRQGGAQAAFTQKIDAAAGRVDIAIVRPGDVLGASGTGVVGAVLFEAIAPGSSPLSLSGVGTLAGGGVAPLRFQPATVAVK